MADRKHTITPKLRRNAEERFKKQSSTENTHGVTAETQHLVHELQVHQIELEMQKEELQQSRADREALLEKYTCLYDFAPVGYFTLDQNATICSVNLAGAALLETQCSLAIGQRFTDLVATADRVAFADFLDLAFVDANKQTCEIELQKAGQTQLFVRIEAVVSTSGQDCLLAIIDITSQKIAEYLNKRTNAILQMIATDHSADQIYSRIALLYEQRHPELCCSMLTLKGNKLFHASSPSLPVAYSAAIDGLECGPNAGSCGTAIYTGTRVIVEDIASDPRWTSLKIIALAHGLHACWSELIRDSSGQVLGAFGMYHNHPKLPNATQLADLESAARLAGMVMEREKRDETLIKLSNSLDQSREAVFITDEHGFIEYVNSEFSRLTGYSAKEMIGQSPSLLMSDKHRLADFAPLWKTVTSGQVWDAKIIIQRKDCSCYPVQLTVSPVKNTRGQISNYLGVQIDLTELQRLEEQLQQAQKIEALGTLVGGIAHDFNNTLAGITGNLFLAKNIAAKLPSAVEKLTQAEKLAFQAAETIKQLLSFARKGILQKHPLPIASFLQEAFRLQQITIPENISLKIKIHDRSMNVCADVNQLQQVLMNLLNNARDAVAEVENPTILIELKKFFADSSYLKNHPYVKGVAFACISISDNGCGMDEHIRKHVFEPFFTTKAVGKGTGLGLSMAYGTIKSHDGHIEVTPTESGPGTIFSFYLPIVDGEEALLPADPAGEIFYGRGETILLVDDNEIVLEMGKQLLEELNYKVLTAKDGRQAIEVHRKFREKIALLVLDVIMPQMGGIEALQTIRLDFPETKALFCTGYDKINVGFGEDGIKQEAVITKPFRIREFSQKIMETLG
jgi:PAS domain S-box-containing protein